MLPAAVVKPSARERCSGAAERPTTPKTTPKPVPAMPSPTKISSHWCWKGLIAKALKHKPAEYRSVPKRIARLSPNRSAMAPKIGVPSPQAKFCIARASENSLLNHPRSAAIGI